MVGTLCATMKKKAQTRLNVSLTPESRAALERFSASTGIAAEALGFAAHWSAATARTSPTAHRMTSATIAARRRA